MVNLYALRDLGLTLMRAEREAREGESQCYISEADHQTYWPEPSKLRLVPTPLPEPTGATCLWCNHIYDDTANDPYCSLECSVRADTEGD